MYSIELGEGALTYYCYARNGAIGGAGRRKAVTELRNHGSGPGTQSSPRNNHYLHAPETGKAVSLCRSPGFFEFGLSEKLPAPHEEVFPTP